MSKSVRLLVPPAIVVMALTTSALPAGATTDVQQSPLLVAATTGLTDAQGNAAQAGLAAYETSSGTVQLDLRLCPASGCQDYSTNSASLSTPWPGETVELTADLSGVGQIDVLFSAEGGNSQRYECLSGSPASFLVEGTTLTSDVEGSTHQGSIGSWRLDGSGCGVWATQSGLAYQTA